LAASAAPEDRDVHRIGARLQRTGLDADDVSGHRVVVVKRDGGGGLREAREEAVPDHVGSACADLLGGLADHHQRPVPRSPVSREPRRSAEPSGHMKVVSAGVHDVHRLPRRILRGRHAREGEAGFFLDRKGVELRADHDDRSRAVPEDAHDACSSHSRGHIEPEVLQEPAQPGRGRGLLVRQLRMRVKLAVDRLERGGVGSRYGRCNGECCQHE